MNLIAITEKEFNRINGEIIRHDGSYILARGEATGSVHRIAVKNPPNMIIKKDAAGNTYLKITEEAEITHTADHATIHTPPLVFYRQTPEREIDHFADSITRKVID